MKRIILSFCVALAASLAQAEVPSADLVDRYIALAGLQTVVQDTVKSTSASMTQGMSRQEADGFEAIMAATFDWKSTQPAVAELIRKTYTREELEAAVAYMQSPAGASAISKQTQMTEGLSSIYGARIQQILSGLGQAKK